MRTFVLLLVLTLTSCSDALPEETALPDAAPSVESECEPEFGQVYVMDTVELLPPGLGMDLNGDGTADNALGLFADRVNDGWRESLSRGNTNYLWELRHWAGPPSASDPDLELAFYKGLDADSPADPSDNYQGQGEFLVSARNFDIRCEPTSRFDESTLDNGQLTALTKLWEFIQPSLGTVQIADFHFWLKFSDHDMRRFEAGAGGVYTLCGLSNALVPSSEPETWLDMIVLRFGIQPDMDRDGDGLERVTQDGDTIRCIDGDGSVIERRDCACDPRIVDGLSAALRGTGVPARIVGLFDTE